LNNESSIKLKRISGNLCRLSRKWLAFSKVVIVSLYGKE